MRTRSLVKSCGYVFVGLILGGSCRSALAGDRPAMCESDPWSLPPEICGPKINSDTTQMTVTYSDCWDGGGGWRETIVEFQLPKVFDDHAGNYDRITVQKWNNPDLPGRAIDRFLRNGVEIAVYESDNDQTVETIDRNSPAATIPVIMQTRKDIQDVLRSNFEMCGILSIPRSYAKSNAICDHCRYGKYAIIAAAAAAGALAGGAVGLVIGIQVGKAIAEDAWADACRAPCEIEKCWNAYEDCKAGSDGGSTKPTIQDYNRPLGSDQTDDDPGGKCFADYIKCSHQWYPTR